MAQWKPIDLMDVIGMASNPVNPGTKFAKRLLNVYPHIKPGALTLRNGYAPKYTPPSNSTISGSTFLNFGVFFDRQADEDGVEIICEIQKGIISALTENDVPVVSNTMEGFWFWTRPYWNGAQWLSTWNWVNKTFITKIMTIDGTYSEHYKIFGNLSHGLGDDTITGWTIYNLTKDEYAKVLTSKLESTGIWVNISRQGTTWEVDDVIICSRCWIDIDAQLEFYNNVEQEDIMFHRINNDLRIGFGGKQNRPGLMVGYRKSYELLSEIDFTSPHPDLAESGALEKYSGIDGIIIEPHILNDQYGIEVSTAPGTLTAATYYLKLTGEIDNYQEQFLAEANASVDGSQNLTVRPYIRLGRESRRLTKLTLYVSTDNITFYKLSEYITRLDTYDQPTMTLEEDGRLFVPAVNFQEAGEYHTDSNAMSITNESLSVGFWLNLMAGNSFLQADTSLIISGVTTATPQSGSYLIAWYLMPSKTGVMSILSPFISYTLRRLNIQFQIIAKFAATIRISTYNSTDYVDIAIPAETWTQVDVNLTISQRIIITTVGDQAATQRFALDEMTITNSEVNEIIYGSEMALEMGYTPTLNLVKGWDMAIERRGRIYYLNPFVEKRYENFLLVSHIHSNNSFMWDIASFDNFRELDKKDSNEAVAITLLPNNEILILKDSSLTTLSEDGLVGIPREPIYGIDCVSKNSLVNINGLIFWCGKEEIYMLNIGSSLVPKPMLQETIRDLYLAIEEKSKIFATRNRFNTYRLRAKDQAQKVEYLLIDTGWVEERKWHYPEIYRPGFNNKLYFMSEGYIYEEQVDYTLPTSSYGEETDE